MIPVANTTLTVTRVTQPEDGYSEKTEAVVLTGVRAVISEPSYARGSQNTTDGARVELTRKVVSDNADIRPEDKVTCSVTGATYIVSWVSRYAGPVSHLTLQVREAGYVT